jgi:hypothetical protein
MDDKDIYSYIKSEEVSFKTTRVPLTSSKDWNMSEHIERCTAVSGGFFFNGINDGSRPYDDIVTPVIDVAFRLEGFNVKDIVPYVEDIEQSYKSFLIKKFHPQWARKNQLDLLIDEIVESSIIYDLVLVKDVNSVRPEVVSLQDIAFCDQTDVLSGPICLRHQYSISDILEYKGKWDDKKIEEVVTMAKASKKVKIAGDREAKTPGKYIECYELYGSFPESWLREDGDPEKYVDQMHLINYYTSSDGAKNGITLYKGKSKKITDKFKALKIDTVRSKNRACGRSIVERLFEPQVWNNYSAIKIKKMLDSAVNLLQTDSEEYGNKKVSELKENTVLKHEPGRPLVRVDMGIQNITAHENMALKAQNSARMLGSASEASLGKNPTAGTPFALQDLIVNEGAGIHEYRGGKIASFFSDILYPDLILKYLVDDMVSGKKFSEELTLDEMKEVSDKIAITESNKRIKDLILAGNVVTKEQQDLMLQVFRDGFKKGGNRKFFEIIKDEMKDIPIKVFINIKGKQRDMVKNADSLTKIIQFTIANAQAIQSVPGISKAVNELLEEVGMSAIDFAQLTNVVSRPIPSPIETPVAV